MSQEILELLSRYKLLSDKQTHHIIHGYTGMPIEDVKTSLNTLVETGKIYKKRCAVVPFLCTEDYYYTDDYPQNIQQKIFCENLFPDDLNTELPPTIAGYFSFARPLEKFDKYAVHGVIEEDIRLMNHLNWLVGEAVKLGCVSLPQKAKDAFSSGRLHESSGVEKIHIHCESVEDFYLDKEQVIWWRLLDSADAEKELQDERVRTYITSQFFHLLFTRPEFLKDGSLFDREFVKAVHPGLTCIHDIAAITDDKKEQMRLFTETTNQMGKKPDIDMPDDLSLS